MRIALFSDVHANLPALEACFKTMETYSPDAIYCLGDLVGYNVWPNEVINEVQRRRIPTIAGNYDQGIGSGSDDCGCAYKTDEEKEMGQLSISYTNAVVNDNERDYLRTLPVHIRLEFQFHSNLLSLLLVHGSPRRVNEYLFEDRHERSLLNIMEKAGADILCFGHTHKPYHRVLVAANGRHLHAINIGSVGKPKDGDPRGGFVLLNLPSDTNILQRDSIGVEFIRFTYDIEAAACAIEQSPLPNAYADMLRNAW